MEKKPPRGTKNRLHGFRSIGPETSILRGSHAIDDSRFKQRNRGRQSAPCSVIAIIYGRLFEPKLWTKKLIDEILQHGDKLYATSVTRNRLNPSSRLTPKLVYPEFYIDDYKCRICVNDGIVNGNLFSASIGCPDFVDGLRRFFQTHESAIVTAQENSVAVWRRSNNEIFYHDANCCDENGCRSKDGVACVVRSCNIDEIGRLFLRNMDRRYDSRYCIDKIDVLRVTLIDRGILTNDRNGIIVDDNILRTLNPMGVNGNESKRGRTISERSKILTITENEAIVKETPKITISNYQIDAKLATVPFVNFRNPDIGNGYRDIEVNVPSTFNVLSNKISIIHGWTHEGSEMYKGKGSQNVANCVMSIVMKKIYPVKTWLRPRLDEILVNGDALHATVKNEKPTIKTMTAADLDDRLIKVNDRKMFVDVDILTIVGTISSKIPEILSLKRGLEEFFLVNDDGVVECSSMAIAVWTQDDYYYTFDPRQCDGTGLRILDSKDKGKTSKKDVQTVEKKIKGKCCAIRFTDLDDLVGLFVKNVDPTKRNDRFVVRSVVVTDAIPGTRPWKEFQPCEAGKTWILRGGISNDDEDFSDENRGRQGIAMSVIGLINANDTSPAEWSEKTVDEAVRDGDSYFDWCTSSPENDEKPKLTVGNVKKTVYAKNRKIQIDIEESTIVGNVEANDKSETLDLVRGIAKFFETRTYGIVEIDDLSVAVWKFDEEQNDKTKETFYYCYDANPRGRLGRKNVDDDNEEPSACVVRAADHVELARLIESNVDREIGSERDFAIHELKIIGIGDPMTNEEIENDKAIGVKPDLNFYTEIGENGACLNGSYDQTNETIFRPSTRNKQQAANALITLAMRKLYDPHLWYREVVDDVIKLGDRLTRKNLGNLIVDDTDENEIVRDYLLPGEIDGEFDVGVNRLTVNLDEEIVTGKIDDLTQNLEDFFASNSMGIFRRKNVILPIWKENDVYFTMDPRGRDNRGIPNEKDGTSTVLWFTEISSLSDSLRLSIPQTNDDDFVVDGVTLENVYSTRIVDDERPKRTTSSETLWHRFPKTREGTWELSGNVTMADDRFDVDDRNKQTAAIAVMAIIFSKAYEPRQWSNVVMDEIMVTGDKLHSQCVKRLGRDSPPRINEIVREFFLSNRRIDLTMEDCVQAGDLGGKPPKVQDLLTGLENYFKLRDCGVLTVTNDVNVAVWKYDDFYYALLPGGDDTSDLPRTMRFANLEFFASYLKEIFGNDGDYALTFINVIDREDGSSFNYDPSAIVRPSNLPPLNAYRKFQGRQDGARAILRAGVHQASEIFPDKIRDKQTASNCIVALAVSVVKNPVTWTRYTLDEILGMGSLVHRQTEKFRPNAKKFKPKDVVRVFHVGVNVMTADVEASTISGPIAVPPVEPEVKTKGKAKAKKPAKAKKAKKGKQTRIRPPPPPPIYLEEGLKMFFQKNRAGILVTGRFMIAVWKDQGVFFAYDPRSTDASGSRNDDGTSCVVWFACLEPLYELVFGNIYDDEKYGRYEINRVVVRTTIIESLPCPADFRTIIRCVEPTIPVSSVKRETAIDVEILTEYNVTDDDVSVLNGTLHLDHRYFDVRSRGLQSTAIAAVAIVVASLHVPSAWTSPIVDAILKHGDSLHVDSTRASRTGARNLSPVELIDVFVVGDFRAEIRVRRRTAAGILNVSDVLASMTHFFRDNRYGILHTGNMAVAFMRHCGKFYVFDPSPRNSNGRRSHEGSACVVESRSIERLVRIFVENLDYKKPTVYTINAVDVIDLHFFSDSRSECVATCDKMDG